LADGIYSSTVSFTSNGGDVDVSLVFQVMSSNLSSEGSLGNISVILKDINSGAEIPLQIQSAAAGQYSFSIDGVEQGVYEIHSGTDIDNDGVICGIAEACGAYPTLMSPATVIVNGNVENLDFSLEIDGSAYSE
jgi:serine protease